ncbi:DUF305 domain-containing protein [Actinoallomurus iriomotensis]|uniref:DUF305 domain-containing protein n=1 Tax=Actinoallomurus iriomotensis TaxID=478107 RepID=A0A9W6S9S3_9ACTN|nr:DUF305 domain-containing protein [Actinoallomurus iriomotensis]GLY89654.1 hypothetical protein Airi02_075830 [Actinoallomurus iriomotensis]
MNRAFFLISPVVATVVLTSYGNGETGSRPPMAGHHQGVSATTAPAEHNSQDVMFAQMMIPHHGQAIVMADEAATRASSPQVRSLAEKIKNAQQPEIDTMTGWLQAWGKPTRPRRRMHMAEGMMSEQDMSKLQSLSGRPFDRMFLQMMIKHHQGAVSMAEAEKEQGAAPDAKALADSIISSQSTEIATMRRLLKRMGPE